jgi:hypothetical protein
MTNDDTTPGEHIRDAADSLAEARAALDRAQDTVAKDRTASLIDRGQGSIADLEATFRQIASNVDREEQDHD